jgi:hypothetical protein
MTENILQPYIFQKGDKREKKFYPVILGVAFTLLLQPKREKWKVHFKEMVQFVDPHKFKTTYFTYPRYICVKNSFSKTWFQNYEYFCTQGY